METYLETKEGRRFYLTPTTNIEGLVSEMKKGGSIK